MTENKGWIKLYRSLLMNELWIRETFTKGQAWVDILLRVNHKDNKVLIGNQSIEVLKGQTIWSIKDMANRWKWSRKKVTNFLKMLKKEHQIDYKSTTKYTIVTVVNWEVYQNELQEGTSNIEKKNIKGTSKEHQKNTNKNDKECNKNDKKNIYSLIIDYLNKKAGKKFKAETKETQRLINGRIKEGFKLEDFKKVIDNKCNEWIGKTTREGKSCEDWLNPQTLFRPSNFEKYLNQKSMSNKTNVNSSQNNNNGWNGYKKFK